MLIREVRIQTLSAKSNFAAILRIIGQKSKIRIFL